MTDFLLIALGLALVATIYLTFKLNAANDRFRNASSDLNVTSGQLRDVTSQLRRFDPIVSVEAEVLALREQTAFLETRIREQGAESREIAARIDFLNQEKRLLEELHDLHDVGFYKTQYNLENSQAYSQRIDALRDRQKEMISSQAAARATSTFLLNGNAKQGEKMLREQIKLMLRAFNGECDASIAKVNFKNFETMRARIFKAAETITKLGSSKGCLIEAAYVQLKIQELALVFEYELKKQEEREEQRRIRQQMQEEIREQRERDKALSDARREEEKAQRELLLAQEKMRSAVSEAKRAELEQQVILLQQRIEDSKRKQSMAELTKSGHVYVISNLGSFGDQVFKIGMTRRLDPMDRVWELGDASVPFDFDVHAIIYAEDAPKLENTLHKHFDAVRVNKVNTRKEFFNADVESIERAVRHHCPDATIEFTKLASADEWRKSRALAERDISVPVPEASETRMKVAIGNVG